MQKITVYDRDNNPIVMPDTPAVNALLAQFNRTFEEEKHLHKDSSRLQHLLSLNDNKATEAEALRDSIIEVFRLIASDGVTYQITNNFHEAVSPKATALEIQRTQAKGSA